MNQRPNFVGKSYKKSLVFQNKCFINLDDLFNIEVENKHTRFPEKPFRNLVPKVGAGAIFDSNHRASENFRYQMAFFIIVTLFHQVGDSLDVIRANRDVLLLAGLKEGPVTKWVGVYVNSIIFLFEIFYKTYGFSPRNLGKLVRGFVVHSLDQMAQENKKPTQYSKKITNQLLRK